MASTLDLLNAARIAFYDNMPSALLVRNANQSVSNSTDTAISFDTVSYDNWTGWVVGSPTRYTIQVAGTYSISGSIAWAGSAAGRRISYLRINGSTQVPGSAGDFASSAVNTLVAPTPTILYQLSVGNYIELIGNQNCGVALNTNSSVGGNAFVPSLTVQWIHN